MRGAKTNYLICREAEKNKYSDIKAKPPRISSGLPLRGNVFLWCRSGCVCVWGIRNSP